MKLSERLNALKGNPMICLGAHSSFLMIMPKDELRFFLEEDKTAKEVFNEILLKDQKKGKRKKEKPKTPYIDREVIAEEWNEIPHHALIIKIEGHEFGQYALRGEVVQQDLTREFHVDSEGGCEWLVDEILADFAHDITNFLVFESVYHHGELNLSGQRRYEELKRPYTLAVDFFRSGNVNMWTEISGDWIIKQAERDVDNRKHDIQRRVCKLRAWDARLNGLYNTTQKDKIVDLIVEGVTPANIIKIVGKGKGELATTAMFKDICRKFENAMRKETKRYLSGEECLEMDVPLKQQMKINNELLERNLRERMKRATGKEK